jgi:hypothetical protein
MQNAEERDVGDKAVLFYDMRAVRARIASSRNPVGERNAILVRSTVRDSNAVDIKREVANAANWLRWRRLYGRHKWIASAGEQHDGGCECQIGMPYE